MYWIQGKTTSRRYIREQSFRRQYTNILPPLVTQSYNIDLNDNITSVNVWGFLPVVVVYERGEGFDLRTGHYSSDGGRGVLLFVRKPCN